LLSFFALLRENGKANRKALAFAYDGPTFPDEWCRVAAYFLWEQDGCPDGKDVEHWNNAKAELLRLAAVSHDDNILL
jgi:hypothetical protein